MDKLLIVFASLTLTGCASVPVVYEAQGEKSIGLFSTTCDKPYKLTQDCKDGLRNIRIGETDSRIAASEDGKIIMIMEGHLFKNTTLGNPLFLNNPRHSEAVNESYETVKQVLDDKGIKRTRVIPIEDLGDIHGYVLELASPGYELLKRYTIE